MGEVGSKLGGAAPGFEPRTSCMRVRSVTIALRGPPHLYKIILKNKYGLKLFIARVERDRPGVTAAGGNSIVVAG